MDNKQDINNLVNVALHHVQYALNAVEEAESLSTSTHYISDVLRRVFSNLAQSQYYLNVANDVTESISV
jgi:hypothetical protein